MTTHKRYIRDLAVGDTFTIDTPTEYVCIARRTADSRTTVSYVLADSDDDSVWAFTRTNLSTVAVLS